MGYEEYFLNFVDCSALAPVCCEEVGDRTCGICRSQRGTEKMSKRVVEMTDIAV